MNWDAKTKSGVDMALNEADVLGLHLDASDDFCDLLLHVVALPPVGPIDPDARRLLRLLKPSQVRVLLRRDRMAGTGCGPAVPLENLQQVEDFFASLRWGDSMYGWRFLDDDSLLRDWPKHPSLLVDLDRPSGKHSIFWFNECGRDEAGTLVPYCIEGTVTFDDLEVLQADGTAQPLDVFIADADRYWEGLHGDDERLTCDAQRAAQQGAPSWRYWARQAVTVSGLNTDLRAGDHVG